MPAKKDVVPPVNPQAPTDPAPLVDPTPPIAPVSPVDTAPVAPPVNDKALEVAAEQQLAAEEKSMLARLKACPYVPVIIPPDPQNPKDKIAVVVVNGVPFSIPRDGQPHKVPEPIAAAWYDSYSRTIAVDMRIESDPMSLLQL